MAGARRWRRHRRTTRAIVVLGVALLAAPLLAHHSFASVYIEQDTIEVEGNITRFEFKNPHSWIYVNGQERFGPLRSYAAEWASTSRLDSDGIDKTTLHIGDTVRIWASPNRDPNDNRVRLKRIERPSDGWKWGGGRGDAR
jgi:hypothetical protein